MSSDQPKNIPLPVDENPPVISTFCCSCVAGKELWNHLVGLLFQSAHYSMMKLNTVPPTIPSTSALQTWHRTQGIHPEAVDCLLVRNPKTMLAKESKPNLSHSQVTEVIRRLYGLNASVIRPLSSYDDQNFYVDSGEGGEYVLKVMNSTDSQNVTLMQLQTHSMNFLHQNGLPAQTALPTLMGELMSLEEFDCGFGKQKYLVRLLTYMPGTTIAKITPSPQILYEVGKMAATLDTILLQMEHPNISCLQREGFIWSLSSIPLLNQYLYVMDGNPAHKIIKAVLEQYDTQVVPKLSLFRKCINHGDLNDHNLLMEPDGPSKYKMSGILDFGDMSRGYFIFELAISIMYMMIENPDPINVGGPVLAGWESVFRLNEAERDCLYLLVLCRFCQSLVLARYTVTQQPENEEYLMTTAKTGLLHLCRLWELGKEEVERIWFQSDAQFRQSAVIDSNQS